MTESQPAQIAQPAQPAPPVPAIAIFFPPPPRRLRLRAGRWPRWARRILVLVVAIVGIGLIASIALDAPLLPAPRRERLFRDGVVAAGSIVSVTRHKTRPALLLEYRFTDAAGVERLGIHTIPGIDIESPLQIGEPVTIFYNPRRPDQ